MKKEPSGKFKGINTHYFHFTVTSVVLISKKYPVIFNLDNSMVSYSDSMSVSTEVFNHIFRFSE